MRGRGSLKWCCWSVIVLAQVVLIWPETDLYCWLMQSVDIALGWVGCAVL